MSTFRIKLEKSDGSQIIYISFVVPNIGDKIWINRETFVVDSAEHVVKTLDQGTSRQSCHLGCVLLKVHNLNTEA